MLSKAKSVLNGKTETAIFASGCFWGTQYYLERVDGVTKTTAGYTGGETKNPTYKQVSSHKTGHVEAVEIEYDPKKVGYEELARLFFETHDPTQHNGQGPDIGPQYRSVIFYLNVKQKKTAEKLITILKSKNLDVATKIKKAEKFYPAESYHQAYYQKTGGTPYCHAYRKLF